MSIFIGIDPGSRLTGYGIIRLSGDKLERLDAGTIHAYSQGETMPERLKRIFDGVSRIVEHYQKYTNEPMTAAIEQVFMASNPDTALKLGQARGAAIAAMVAKDLQVAEYTARQIKQAVCGYGAADKEQIQLMVMRLLSLEIQPQADAADGLACAICHAYHSQTLNKLLGGAAVIAGQGVGGRSKKKGRWRLTDVDLGNLS
ncbi:crossover junction endodeoxyribonuclease RuvC [Moraxella osloensis]|uniref:Crossover junction endodeoxyribonuclease RuvC n=1 Tax=Faucicola osloensis TaxID=34062 RepID=A0A2D2LVD6_FAUOS|nr:crossover junction endodeoxyribonuclease RuvC [Moraxella osloensis]ATR78997.1 crossover junction endodeoxyribonuclease RuvC [Moraxella osloensis]